MTLISSGYAERKYEMVAIKQPISRVAGSQEVCVVAGPTRLSGRFDTSLNGRPLHGLGPTIISKTRHR